MNLTQLFKFLVLNIFISFLFAEELKPLEYNEIIKIKLGDKNRTYYHLNKNEELYFAFDDFKDKSDRHSIKFLSRTIIASNSNSKKTFGIELNIYQGKNLLETRELSYNKKTSDAINESKPGWNYTTAGFWFEEFNDLNNLNLKIKLLKGSPSVEIRAIIDKINLRSSSSDFEPITKNNEYIIKYKTEKNDTIFLSSDNWYLLKDKLPLQYKIKGPKIIRIISRATMNNVEEKSYSFEMREDGRFVSNYNYKGLISMLDSYVKGSNSLVSGYNSSFFNVPKGIHYYTFTVNENIEKRNDTYLKIELYED